MASENDLTIYVDKSDVKAMFKDLERLEDDFKATRAVIRSAIKSSAKPMAKAVRANAAQSLSDDSRMSLTWRWNSKVKRNVLYVWYQSRVKGKDKNDKKGAWLSSIFEGGTVDRYTKSGYWTGRIQSGTNPKSGITVKTKFTQRGFDAHKDNYTNSIVRNMKAMIDKRIAKSKKLTKK